MPLSSLCSREFQQKQKWNEKKERKKNRVEKEEKCHLKAAHVTLDFILLFVCRHDTNQIRWNVIPNFEAL